MAKLTLQVIPYGGVHGSTLSAIVGEVIVAMKRGHDIRFVSIVGDSLLPRRRSVVLTEFYDSGDDVIVTVDDDISWQYGDAYQLAERALELDAIVGGLYSKRCEGKGWASRIKPGMGPIEIPSDRLVECDYIGSGFMAIPRSVVQRILDNHEKCGLRRCWNGTAKYWDFYHTMSIPHHKRPEYYEYLSEDWSLCERAKIAGVPLYTDLRPRIVHYGERGFNAGDGAPKPKEKPE